MLTRHGHTVTHTCAVHSMRRASDNDARFLNPPPSEGEAPEAPKEGKEVEEVKEDERKGEPAERGALVGRQAVRCGACSAAHAICHVCAAAGNSRAAPCA